MEQNKKESLIKEVKEALEQLRKHLQADGGDVAFVELTDDGIVYVELQGRCGSCPYSLMTLKNGIEVAIKEAIPEIKAVEAVKK